MLTDIDSPRLSLVPEPSRTSTESMLTPSMYPNERTAKLDYDEDIVPQSVDELQWTGEWYIPGYSTVQETLDGIPGLKGEIACRLYWLNFGEMEGPPYEHAVDHSIAPWSAPSTPWIAPSIQDDVLDTASKTYASMTALPAQEPTMHEWLDPNSATGCAVGRTSRLSASNNLSRGDQLRQAEVRTLQDVLRIVGHLQSSHILALVVRRGSRHVGRSILSEAEQAAAKGDKACAALLGETVVIEILGRRGWRDHLSNPMMCIGQVCVAYPVVLYQPASLTYGDPLVSQEHTPLGRRTGANPLVWYRKSIQGLLSSVSVPSLPPVFEAYITF
jgi:hypothetical protein